MTTKVTPRKIKKALRKLGDTPEKIAASLQERGIKGYRGDAKRCPIANYLRSEFGGDYFCGYVGVGRKSATVGAASTNNIPSAVSDFIRAYDGSSTTFRELHI